MTRHALLNNVDHKDLRVITERSAKFGDNVRGALTFSWEFRSVQAHYPIVFNKNPETGVFTALAMFGFEEGENLFLGDDGWTTSYIPMTMLIQPFLIGFQGSP
ncbi:MAG: SapC family protein, partial [Gammaproteobacteria bacterium]|nr:SapC family protein [Gammaproteobacteria bacterium]